MKRKIEKYIAKKTGIDECAVRPGDDGRYDLMGDLEGVLSAVRGKDPTITDSDTKSKSAPNSAASSASNLSHPTSSSNKKVGLPMAYPHYTPYMSGIYGHAGQYPSMPPNRGNPYTPWAVAPPEREFKRKLMSPTPSPLAALQNVSLSTPGVLNAKSETAFQESFMSSTKKTIFDLNFSPPAKLPSHSPGSPSHMSIQGMTPPLSCLKDIFATPVPSGNAQKLSPDEAESLNKSLFADTSSVLTPFDKNASPSIVIRMSDTGNQDFICNMSLSNRVSISPIYRDISNTPFYLTSPPKDDDVEKMPPPTAPRVRNAPTVLSSVKEDDDIFHISMDHSMTPRAISQSPGCEKFTTTSKLMKQLATPGTAATVENSFWSDQGLDMSPSLSPLRTPAFLDKSERVRGMCENEQSPSPKRRRSSFEQ